jgi:hypothetical protein
VDSRHFRDIADSEDFDSLDFPAHPSGIEEKAKKNGQKRKKS